MTHLGHRPSNVLSSFTASDDKSVVTLRFSHECLLGALDLLVSAQRSLRQVLFDTIESACYFRRDVKHARFVRRRGWRLLILCNKDPARASSQSDDDQAW